jgi:hypothetical protein
MQDSVINHTYKPQVIYHLIKILFALSYAPEVDEFERRDEPMLGEAVPAITNHDCRSEEVILSDSFSDKVLHLVKARNER